MWGADKGRSSCVQLLLDAGASKDLKDNVCTVCCVTVSNPSAIHHGRKEALLLSTLIQFSNDL
jgi:hypothetical protein